MSSILRGQFEPGLASKKERELGAPDARVIQRRPENAEAQASAFLFATWIKFVQLNLRARLFATLNAILEVRYKFLD